VDEIINGYQIVSDWRNGQRGMTAAATRGGKKYFLKKYTKAVLPTYDGMFDEKTIRFKKEYFDDFVRIRRRVISALTPIAGPGGNVVIPCDNFIDGLHYYEATEFIEGVVSDDRVEEYFRTMSADDKMMMLKTAAGALSAVHGAGIIHSDLKLKNIIVVENSSGRFVAKLIDFDSSYPIDEKKFIGGDDAFCSPELARYSDSEDEAEQEELLKFISEKTDIFSLGVCFHYFFTQQYPGAVELSPRLQRKKELCARAGKPCLILVKELIYDECELKVSDSITSVNLKALIYDMLEVAPEKRPTAMQVLQRLKQGEPTFEEPWPEHNITVDRAKLSDKGIVGLKKATVGGSVYEAIFATGKKSVYTREELISQGFAAEKLPLPGDVFHDGCIGYHLREGEHYLGRYDWNRFMDFIDSKTANESVGT